MLETLRAFGTDLSLSTIGPMSVKATIKKWLAAFKSEIVTYNPMERKIETMHERMKKIKDGIDKAKRPYNFSCLKDDIFEFSQDYKDEYGIAEVVSEMDMMLDNAIDEFQKAGRESIFD